MSTASTITDGGPDQPSPDTSVLVSSTTRTSGCLWHYLWVLIGAFGMFWQREAVEWSPGSGSIAWSLLGRRGSNKGTLRVGDFRRARGVYVLFDDHGAHYVGLARGHGGLGLRLKQHTTDVHSKKWSRFCWFSLDGVSAEPTASNGLHEVHFRAKPVPTADKTVISELEALLIIILGTRGQNKMRFESADEWQQVPFWDEKDLLLKVHS